MALELKISYNFLVITDTVSGNVIIREPREDIKYFRNSSDNYSFIYRFPKRSGADIEYVVNSNSYAFTDIIDERTGLSFTNVSELDSYLDEKLATDFSSGSATEMFYFTRTETIDNSTATDVNYFTLAQNSTEINPIANISSGDYHVHWFVLCTSTSVTGRVSVTFEINGVPYFVESFQKEPKDTNDRFYVTSSKIISLPAGNSSFNVLFKSNGSGSARVYEANVLIEKK
jgi:hypothetical protein